MRFTISIFLVLFFFSCSEDSTSPTSSNQASIQSEEGLFKKIDPSKSKLVFENEIHESKHLHHFIWDAFYNGAGVAVGDINNDGLEDVFFTSNYGEDKLFLNKGKMKFEDISSKAKIGGGKNVSSGVTMADVNNDGYLDIYVCKFGHLKQPKSKTNLLYINNKDNTFTEKGAFYGLDNQGFSIQATFFDYDLDGDQDMYLMNQPSNTRVTRQLYEKNGDAAYINQYTSDRLYKNENGKFKDVTKEAGLVNFAFGLGHNVCDINNDGYPDIYVANDYDKPDFYYINLGNGRFEEVGKKTFNHISNFSMGMDIGDINNDGLYDIAVLDMAGATHYRSKTNMPSMSPETFYGNVDKGYHFQYMHNTLQVNQGNNQFSDVAYMAGIAKTDWSWSLLMADFDNDGKKDIHITNGILKDIRNSDYIAKLQKEIQLKKGQVRTTDIFAMLVSTPMDNYMYHNDGNNHFTDKAAKWGLSDKGFSNGAAYADLDNDGDLDLIVNNVNSNASLFENQTTKQLHNNSIRIKPISSKYKRNCVNTKVALYNNGTVQIHDVNPSRGFLSRSEAVAHFGVGQSTKMDSCIITWPDQFISKHYDLVVNKTHVIDLDNTKRSKKIAAKTEVPLFVKEENVIDYKHIENDFDPFDTQLLLPYELSKMGPFLSSGDVNGDNIEDVYIGGSAGQSGSLYLGQKNGTLKKTSEQAFNSDKAAEDQRSVFFDADGDGDQDLYVCSGGYENTDAKSLKDRLYINNGKGSFRKSTLNLEGSSTSTPVPIDIDQDGDLDLAVFGRLVPGKYPQIPASYFLINNKGSFTNKTSELAPELDKLGMVTDAVSSDYDNDGDLDIVVVGEWMEPTILVNTVGKITLKGLGKELSGLYFSVNAEDLDGDGDDDIILGNIGKNTKWKASPEKPFRLYANDFDDNGKYDIVLANYSDDKVVPVRGRQCSSEQLPSITDEFKTFEEFATASIDEIYNLEGAQNLEAQNFYSGVLRNNAGTFTFEKFDIQAQMSPINGITCLDVNNDGKKDIITVGNLFSTEVETTRFDASMGSVILNMGSSFEIMSPSKSGIYAKFDAKDMVLIDGGKKLLITNNSSQAEVYSLK